MLDKASEGGCLWKHPIEHEIFREIFREEEPETTHSIMHICKWWSLKQVY